MLHINLSRSVYGVVRYRIGRFEPYCGDNFINNGCDIFFDSLLSKSRNKYPLITLFEL